MEFLKGLLNGDEESTQGSATEGSGANSANPNARGGIPSAGVEWNDGSGTQPMPEGWGFPQSPQDEPAKNGTRANSLNEGKSMGGFRGLGLFRRRKSQTASAQRSRQAQRGAAQGGAERIPGRQGMPGMRPQGFGNMPSMPGGQGMPGYPGMRAGQMRQGPRVGIGNPGFGGPPMGMNPRQPAAMRQMRANPWGMPSQRRGGWPGGGGVPGMPNRVPGATQPFGQRRGSQRMF